MNFKLIIFLIIFPMLAFGQGNGLYKFIDKNGKYGFINKNGEIKIKPDYLSVHHFRDGLCFVSKKTIRKGYKWICIDTNGNKVFDIKDNFPETDFNEGFARISSFTEHWFINKQGINVFAKHWKDGHGNFKNGLAYVSDVQFQNFYSIDTKGKRTENITYSRIEVNEKLADKNEILPDTMVKFKKDSLWGFKNQNGEIIIEPQYYLTDRFENGLCAVRLKYKRIEVANDYYFDAIINTKGEVVSQQPMHCFLGFQGDLIVYYGSFHFSGGIYYLDKGGQKIIPK